MQLLVGRQQLAYSKDTLGVTPLQAAVIHNNLKLVKILLIYDPNLAYIKGGTDGNTPFMSAVQIGFVSIAEAIMRASPDSVYTPNKNGFNALHEAIRYEHQDIINFILRMPQLRRLINLADNQGNLPLHHAAARCKPKFLRSLLAHARQDYTAVDADSKTAVNIVYGQTDLLKTLKWVSSINLCEIG